MTLKILEYADIEHGYDDPDQIGRLSETIRRRRDENTIVIGGGDNTAPSVLGLVEDDSHIIEFYTAIEPDADTFGNHEFDRSVAELEDLVAASPTTWVCANIFRDGERFGEDSGVVPATVIETADYRVGVVGVTSTETAEIAPNAEPLTFTDAVEAARKWARRVEAKGVDYLICLSHRGDDTDLAKRLDFDVILGAHYHEVRNETVSGTTLVRPGSGGDRLVEVTLESNTVDARVIDVSAGPVDETLAGSFRERINAARLDETVTTVNTPLDRRPWLGETPLGNFFADAFRRAGRSDIGLVNSEAIRDTGTALSGDVTKADIVSLSPFDEELVVLELTGLELLETIRRASGRDIERSEPEWWLGIFGNVSVVWDPEDETLIEARVGGQPVDPDETYTVTTQQYNVREQALFPHLDEDHLVGRAGDMHDALLTYASEEGIPTTTDNRLKRSGGDVSS